MICSIETDILINGDHRIHSRPLHECYYLISHLGPGRFGGAAQRHVGIEILNYANHWGNKDVTSFRNIRTSSYGYSVVLTLLNALLLRMKPLSARVLR